MAALKHLRCRDKSCIVQLDFSSAFDRVSHSALLFKLKSVGVGDCVLSICIYIYIYIYIYKIYIHYLSAHRQRVVVNGSTIEWIPIVSGVPKGSVFYPLLFALYASEMFELVEN